jgi:hypothetical protein
MYHVKYVAFENMVLVHYTNLHAVVCVLVSLCPAAFRSFSFHGRKRKKGGKKAPELIPGISTCSGTPRQPQEFFSWSLGLWSSSKTAAAQDFALN